MSKSWALVVGVCALAVAGCGPVKEVQRVDLSGRDEIRVVATTGMVADVVRRVGGERVAVEGLMGPGVDPHLYKASEGDVRRLERADVIFYSGLHLESKMADVLERVGERRRTRAVAAELPDEKLIDVGNGQHDPHVWFDVSLWSQTVAAVAETLAEADPAHRELYERNAAAFRAELAQLHQEAIARAATVPASQRVIVTAHDAFAYFGRAYGFEVIGLQGISTVAEAGARDVQRLADLIVERRIPAIFVESSVAPRTIEAVQEAVRARGFDVEIGGSLYSDALGSAGTPAGTYPGMVRSNLETIVRALGGDA